MLNAVLFDFSDTLFWRDGPARLTALLGEDPGLDATSVANVWAEVRRASALPAELAKERDSSAEAHRRCWIELLQPFNEFHPNAAELLYADQPNPLGWHPFEETVEVLKTLHERGIPIGVVSDIGWNLRPVFAHHGVDPYVSTWVLSYEHGIEKPHQRMFELGCEALGVSPKSTLMVGDSVEKDAGAARAGLTALTLPPHAGPGERGLRHAVTLLTNDGKT